jgi:protein TonB
VGKLGILGVLVVVLGAHYIALRTQVPSQSAIAKPKAKIQHITLSRVQVKQPKVVTPVTPKPPIMIPPKVIEPKPKPKVKLKKKRKKMPKKKRRKIIPKPRPKPLPKPQPVVIPKVQEVITPVAQVDTASLRDAYLAHVREEIRKHLIYPRMAKRMRMQGVVHVGFWIDAQGKVGGITILDTAKKILAKGARKTLKALSLNPIPKALHEEKMDVNIPIEFKLTKG